MPLVSTIIPVYNGEATIAEAIDSALALANECDLEVVVVDDGSTDSTPAILERYGDRIRRFRQENSGESAARNRAVFESRGQYLAFLDADDLWLPGRVAKTVAALQSDATVGLAFSDWLFVEADGSGPPRTFAFDKAPSLEEMLQRIVPILPTTVTMRRDIFERCGGFVEGMVFGPDCLLMLSARQHCKFAHVPEALALYRRSPEWRYPPKVRASLEWALRERFGRRARGLISALRDDWAEKLLSLALRQTDQGKPKLALYTLIELLCYQPSYLLRHTSPAKVLSLRNFRRISSLLIPTAASDETSSSHRKHVG